MHDFKNNPLLKQVFYSVLIDPLMQIRDELQDREEESQQVIIELLEEIERRGFVEGFKPFPHYQTLCHQLSFKQKIGSVLESVRNDNLDIALEISKFISLSHFFNCLDIIAKRDFSGQGDVVATKCGIFFTNIISKRSFSDQTGVTQSVSINSLSMREKRFSARDCRGKHYFFVSGREILNQDLALSESYEKMINVVYFLISRNQLEGICFDLFSDLKDSGESLGKVEKNISDLCRGNFFLEPVINCFIRELKSYRGAFRDNFGVLFPDEEEVFCHGYSF